MKRLTTAQILSGLFGLAIVLMISPRVLRMNRGKTLQNIALWLAIFLGLALAYKTVGPGRLDAEAPAAIEAPGAAVPAADADGFGLDDIARLAMQHFLNK